MLGPIFVREWITLPRHAGHYLTRSLYLGAFWILILTVWQVTVGWEHFTTMGDLARFGLIAFRFLAYIQLTLLMFFSALSAASAISLEKDRRTFLLLLLTDLHNHEIVLGKLFGSLLQIGVLMLGSVPVLAILALLGGIDAYQIAATVIVLGMTALMAGSLGGLIALWRDKTFQALAMTVLFLVFYLCAVEGLSLVPYLSDDIDPVQVRWWQEAVDPFRIIGAILEPASDLDAVWAALRYGAGMLALTVLLNGIGIGMLRVWNPSGEPIMQREIVGGDAADPERIHAAPGKVRPVWENPVMWREIVTRAYGHRPLLVKAAYFVVLALVTYYALFVLETRVLAAAYGLVPIAILSLLLISAQAVT